MPAPTAPASTPASSTLAPIVQVADDKPLGSLSGGPAVLDNGTYVVGIKNIEETEMPSYEDRNVMEAKWRWTFENRDPDTKDIRPTFLAYTTRTFGPNSNASKIVSAAFSDEELGRFEREGVQMSLGLLRGRELIITLSTTEREGRKYNKIDGYTRPRRRGGATS